MVQQQLQEAIDAADAAGNLEFAAALRSMLVGASRIQTESGERDGVRWTAARPGLPRAEVYPDNQVYRWRAEPALAIEFGGNGDLVLVDPWSGDSLRIDKVYADDGRTPFLVGLRQALEVAEATGWLDGRAQIGRAGVDREG